MENLHYPTSWKELQESNISDFDETIFEPVILVTWEICALVGLLNVKMALDQSLEFVTSLLKLRTILILSSLHFPSAGRQSTLFQEFMYMHKISKQVCSCCERVLSQINKTRKWMRKQRT